MIREKVTGNLYVVYFIILFCLSLFFLTPVIPVRAQQTAVSVSPSSQTVSHYSNPTITVNIRIDDVNDLYGFQFDATYNPNVLQLSSISEEAFLGSDGETTYWISPNLTTPGLINDAACSRQAALAGIDGSGNLAQIRFTINPSLTTIPTSTQVRLLDVKLSDIDSNSIQPFNLNNGTINIEICINGEIKSCGSSIGECQPGNQTCSGNQWGTCIGGVGPSPEICDGLDNDCDGGTDNIIDTANPLTRFCSINHQGICAVGNETCTVGSWGGCPSPQQEICWNGIDEDCNGADSQCEGDINGDGCIDILDLAAVAMDFGKTSGFNPNVDLNSDGEIDIFDLVIVARDFGSGSCGG